MKLMNPDQHPPINEIVFATNEARGFLGLAYFDGEIWHEAESKRPCKIGHWIKELKKEVEMMAGVNDEWLNKHTISAKDLADWARQSIDDPLLCDKCDKKASYIVQGEDSMMALCSEHRPCPLLQGELRKRPAVLPDSWDMTRKDKKD